MSSATAWPPRASSRNSPGALGKYAVAVVGEEPRLAYNRVLLSSLLAGEVQPSEVELKPARWWRDLGVTLRFGRPAVAVDPSARRVVLSDGTTLPFAKLVFATGSRPIDLPIGGMGLAGVLTFRDIACVDRITCMAATGARAVVGGGGLLGLEAAYGLAKTGAKVTLIHLMDRLMERQLDGRAAALLKRAVEARESRSCSTPRPRLVGADRVEAVELRDGRAIPADVVVVAVGVKPNAALARTAGIGVNRGIIVDDRIETNIDGVHAIGECAEHRGVCYGLVEPAYEQARVLAGRLAGNDVGYPGSVLATNLKVSGINVFSAGDFLGGPGTEPIMLSDPGLGTYKKLVIADGRLVVVLFGDTADGLWYLDLIRSGARIDSSATISSSAARSSSAWPRDRHSTGEGSQPWMHPFIVRLRCVRRALCGVGCGVLATSDGRGGAEISGDPEHPANFGRLCSKGAALGETLGLAGRLLHPMVRQADGSLARTSWDDALDRSPPVLRGSSNVMGRTRSPSISRASC